MVLATRTNVGISAETTPQPLAEISASRSEALIAPVYPGGDTPPALAGVSVKANTGLFSSSIGSVFATGRAAVILANPGVLNGGQAKGEIDVVMPMSELDKVKDEMQRIRPVFFATDTSTGLKASWTGAAGQYPDRVHFGYNRKEGALAPLGIRPSLDENGGQRKDPSGNALATVHAPSLIATVSVDVRAASGAKYDQVQFFASGRAADLLAPQDPVRSAVFEVVKPDKPIETVDVAERSPCYDQLTTWLRAGGDTEERKRRVAEVESFLETNGLGDVSVFEVLWFGNTAKRAAAQAAVCQEFAPRADTPPADVGNPPQPPTDQ
jgi:hypothetical protein